MRRPVTTATDGGDDKGGVFDLASLLPRRSPTLHEFLSDERWDDGTSRSPGTLLLFCEAGRYKACLNDRDAERSVFVSGDSVEVILDALETGLSDDSLPWRAKRDQQKKGRR